jgi:hypothetical protein
MGEPAGGLVNDDDVNAKVFWTLAAVGLGVIGFGVAGLFHDSARTHPDQWVRWFVGAALVHDLLLAPFVFVISHFLKERIGRQWRGPLTAAAISSGVFVLIFFPFIRRYGADPRDASILPQDYGMNLLVILALVWTAALVAGLFRARRKKEER